MLLIVVALVAVLAVIALAFQFPILTIPRRATGQLQSLANVGLSVRSHQPMQTVDQHLTTPPPPPGCLYISIYGGLMGVVFIKSLQQLSENIASHVPCQRSRKNIIPHRTNIASTPPGSRLSRHDLTDLTPKAWASKPRAFIHSALHGPAWQV